MPDVLPVRPRRPWLPMLQTLCQDRREWAYFPDPGGVGGTARLRVWGTADGGFFAVVTESGSGLSVTNAAGHIWKLLQARYGSPLGLAEYWPEGESGPAHVDLVLPPGPGLPQEWMPLWPVPEQNVLRGLLGFWWDLHGDEILSPLA